MDRYDENEENDKGKNLFGDDESNHSDQDKELDKLSLGLFGSRSEAESGFRESSKSSKSSKSKPSIKDKDFNQAALSSSEDNTNPINLKTLFLLEKKPLTAESQTQKASLNSLSYYNSFAKSIKGNLLYHSQSNTTYIVTQINRGDSNQFIVLEDKAQKDKDNDNVNEKDKDNNNKKDKDNKMDNNSIKITPEALNEDYVLYRDIKLVYVNYLNESKVITLPVNINHSFDDLLKSLESLYVFNLSSIKLIYKEKIINKDSYKDQHFSDYDFNKDYIIILEEKTQELRCLSDSFTSLMITSPLISSYATLVKKNFDLFSITPIPLDEAGSLYFEIYQLNSDITFSDQLDSEDPKTIVNLGRTLLKANWMDKARLLYTLPLMQINKQEGEKKYTPEQKVTFKTGCIYVIIMHLHLAKNKQLKPRENPHWSSSEFEMISSGPFFIEEIHLGHVSDLFLN